MNKCHSPLNWQNDTTPAINDTNLNYMDGCIDTIDDRVVAMDTSKLESEDIAAVIKSVTMDDDSGVFTFTKWDNSTFTIDTKLEKIAVNFRYDTATQKLVITLDDGTTQDVDLSNLIQETDFADSSTIVWTVTNHVATASVKANSIGDAQMQTGYLTDAQNAKNGAELAATSANTSRLESEGWAVGKQDGVDVPSTSPYYHNNAKYYSDHAGGQSLSALTDVALNDVQDGDGLVYDSAAQKWTNGTTRIEIALLPPTNIEAVGGDRAVTLTWTDPSDVIVGGTVVAEWEMTKVVRKVGSAPTDVDDGTLVLTETTRNQYSTEGYTDSGLTNDTTYYYGIFAIATNGKTSSAGTSATPTQGAIDLTLTLEGAKEDTITVKNAGGDTVATCVFASGQTTGTVTITNFVEGTYTFESSVAKDTTTGTGNYTKNISLSNTSESVSVMPDNVVYWYGNECEDITGGWFAVSFGHGTATKQTNCLRTVGVYGNYDQETGFCTNNSFSLANISTMRCNATVTSYYTADPYLALVGISEIKLNIPYPSNTYNFVRTTKGEAVTTNNIDVDVSTFNESYYVGTRVYTSTAKPAPFTYDINAIWLVG